MNEESMIPNFTNPGAYPDRPDERDHTMEQRFGAPQIDWHKGYDVEVELGIQVKREHQNGSSSCVAQAYTKYAEVLNVIDPAGDGLKDLSAKSIYEQIYLPEGGAYLRDGAKAIVDGGIALESDVLSYENGLAPSEAYMRKPTLTPSIREKMKTFKAKEYLTMGFATPEYVALAIATGHGCVTGATGSNAGWVNFVVRPPLPGELTWGHAIYLVAYGIDEVGKWFEFINSWGSNWGKNGRGRVYFDQYDMTNNFFGSWTLIDQPNEKDMKIVKTTSSPNIYFIDGNKRRMIVDVPTLTAFGAEATTITDTEMSLYQDGGTFVWTERIIN